MSGGDPLATRCAGCGELLPEEATRCPFCMAPRGAGALAFADGAGSLDRLMEQSLARVMTESLLERDESAASLVRDLGLDAASPLAPSELQGAITRLQEDTPSLNELEGLLTTEGAATLDGIQLGDLLDRGEDDVKLLKRGFVFLKRRLYKEALEWWTLHRENLDPTRRRLELLLLMMEAYTHVLAGDKERATQLKAKVRSHPLFIEYTSRVKR